MNKNSSNTVVMPTVRGPVLPRVTDAVIDGRALRTAREGSAKTLGQLGALTGIAPHYIGRIERGESSATAEVAMLLADALGVNTTDPAEPSCPPWCDPTRHWTDDVDGSFAHRSPDFKAGVCGPCIIQPVHGVTAKPPHIYVDPSWECVIETPEEAREAVSEFNKAMTELVALAWPDSVREAMPA